jgi:hypothetical protein
MANSSVCLFLCILLALCHAAAQLQVGRFEVAVNTTFLRPPKDTAFRVALITSGALRTFAFVAKSWHRYIIDPWHDHLYIFAHAIANANCEISTKGLESLKEIATEVEISYSSAPLITKEEVHESLTGFHACERFWDVGHGVKFANVHDMHARRRRAYILARSYALRENMVWDMIFYLRPDCAFYSPVLPLWEYNLIFKQNPKCVLMLHICCAIHLSSLCNSFPRSVMIPAACDFGGVCDRVAIGPPEEMEFYFQKVVYFLYLRHHIMM